MNLEMTQNVKYDTRCQIAQYNQVLQGKRLNCEESVHKYVDE